MSPLMKLGTGKATIELLGAVGPGRAMALVEAAEAKRQAGQLGQSRAEFAAAAEAASAEGDGLALTLAALGVAGIWVYEQRDFYERATLDALWRRARDEVPANSLLAARLDVRVAAEAAYEEGPVSSVERATDAVLAFQDDASAAEALSLLHHVQLGPSQARSRLRLAEEIVRRAARAGDPLLTLTGLCWRTVDLFHLGDRRANQSLQELHERAKAAGCEALAFVADVMMAMRLARSGRLADAEAAAAAAFVRGIGAGDPDAPAYFGAMMAAIRWWQGRGAEVIEQVRSISASPRLGPNDHVYVAADAVLSATLGDVEAAEEALARLTSIGLGALPESSSWLATQFLTCEAAFLLGNAEVAGEVRSLIEPYSELPVLPSVAVVCLGSARRAVGLASATLGDLDAAIRDLEDAIRTDRRLGSRPMAVLTEHVLADIYQARGRSGDHARARELTVRSAAAASRLGMVLPSPPPWLAGSTATRTAAVQHVPGGWRVEVEGRTSVMPAIVGMEYLARLLGSPGEDHDVLKLITLASGGAGRRASGHLLDRRALADYRRRAQELNRLLSGHDLDPAAADGMRREFAAITAALRVATDRHGRVRDFPTDHERARTAVRKALVRAVDSIAAAEPELGGHMRASLTTGAACRYDPAPGWQVRART